MTRPTKRKKDQDVIIGKKYSMRSKILHEERSYWIYLPNSYDKNNKKHGYPVIFLLDGDGYFQSDSGVVHFMSSGINGNCQIPEMILVAIPNTHRMRDLSPTHSKIGYDGKEEPSLEPSGGGDTFLRFMRDELFPEIDSKFNTLPSRLLVGHSLGGLLAIHALLYQPEMFQAYIAMDPSLWWDNELLTQHAGKKIRAIRKLRKTLYISSANGPQIALFNPKKMRNAIRRFVKALDAARNVHFRLGFQYFPVEDHASVHLLSLYHGLLYIFEGFHKTDVESLPAMKARFQRLSKRLGGELQPAEGYVNGMGYVMLKQLKDVEKAIALFEFNVSNFPRSANAYDRLAEGYMVKGDTARAIRNYKKSLQLDPNNHNAATWIRELTKKEKAASIK